MRALALLVPVVLAVVACAEPSSTDDDVEGIVSSGVSRSCSLSRSTIVASVTGGRKTAITRGFSWLDARVPYSQSKTQGGYRTDCSGFVSMCWRTAKPGNSTSTFASSSEFDVLSSYDELLPGDAIDDPGHHIVLFLAWDDAAHKGACVLEQASTASDMQFRVRTAASLKSGGFKPLRPSTFAGADDAPVDRSAADAGSDASAVDTDTDPPACVPKTAAEACNAAAVNGVQCGTVSDGCDATVECDKVLGFGCSASQTCSKHLCIGSTTTPDASAPSTGSDSDVEAQTQGEPGDVSSSPRSSSANVASNGCSSAPGSSGKSAAGLAGLALALAAFVRRRRAR